MGWEPASPLEERLAARLWWRSQAHPFTAELDAGVRVLDGAEALAEAPREGASELPPEACLLGVRDSGALTWAGLAPGVRLVAAVEELWAELSGDLPRACRSTDAATTDDEVPSEGFEVVADAVLVEAVAACERQLAALTARRDQIAGVFAARRQAEAEQDVADARAATAKDGKGRPWATRARSTAPTELCARLGIGSAAGEVMVERGLAAVRSERDVAAAMAAGALPAATGAWLLEELTGVRSTSYVSALQRETASREEAIAAARAAEDAARADAGQPALTRAELRARAADDRARVDAEAAAAAHDHAERVAAQVRRELLGRATGSSSWPPPSAAQELVPHVTEHHDGSAGPSKASPEPPTSRPTAGAGLGPNRRAWKKRLTTAVHRADADAAAARAASARAACSTQRWTEPDGQGALLLRGPVEDIALITAAMDARARRRQDEARAAERAAAKAEGRPVDRSAAGSLDAHRIAALREWATAALEISETSGVSGTWYPVARTAASKPTVHLVLPWTVLAGVSTIGAQLAGYGPLGALAALRIAADGLWRRVLADPGTGAAVGVEERSWRPSTSLARLVSLRWAGSTMPGSTRPVGFDGGPGGGGGGGGASGGRQLDHVVPYASDEAGRSVGGPTEATNLQLLAQVEHLLKQAGEHARAGHGWSVAVDRVGPHARPTDDRDPGGGASSPPPSPGDGVVWTSPTGHTYRVGPEQLLDPDDASSAGGLPGWAHRLLADVLPAWVGWPPDGPPPPTATAPAWSTDWAGAVFTDPPPDAGLPEAGDGEEPCLFDDLPAA